MTNQHHNDIVLQFLFDSVAQRVVQIQNNQGVQFEQFARQQQDRIDQLEDALRESHLERQRLEENEREAAAWTTHLENSLTNHALKDIRDEYEAIKQGRNEAFAEAIAPATAGKVIAADAQCVNCGVGSYSAEMPMDNDGNCLNCGEPFTAPTEAPPVHCKPVSER